MLEIVSGDITKLDICAIVNAANTELRQGGGVCGAIFKGAGEKEMKEACDPLGPIETGDSVITKGFKLPAKYVIHTAGPIYKDGKSGEEEALINSYRGALELAKEYECEGIGFPLLSSGIYGYPKEEAMRVAIETIEGFLKNNDMAVKLVIFDKKDLELAKSIKGSN